jgi:hypothetical protein
VAAWSRRYLDRLLSSRAPQAAFVILESGSGHDFGLPPQQESEILRSTTSSPVAMIRKKTATITVAGIAAVVLSSMVAYRMGVRHAAKGAIGTGSMQTPAGGCVALRDAGLHTGENTCVEGRVLRVFTARSGSTFLDFCQDYRNCAFGSVIFASDRSRFGNLGSLEGRKVEIAGEITTYNGRAEIIIRDPKQIRVPE